MTVNGRDIRQHVWFQNDAPKIASSFSFEEREAARFAGLTWEEYMALPGTPYWVDPSAPSSSKAEVIAHYRTTRLFESVKADMEAERMKPKGRRPGR